MAAMLREGRVMNGHVYQPGPDGFCQICQEAATYCAGSLPYPQSDTQMMLSQPVSLIRAVPGLRQHIDGDMSDSGDTHPRPRTSWTAAELMATDFPEPRWAVPGVVAEGLTVLAGP